MFTSRATRKGDKSLAPSSAQVSCDINVDAAAFISPERVREAVNSFGSFKAPGTDGFPPCVLQNLEGRALHFLVDILKAWFSVGLYSNQLAGCQSYFYP